MIKASAFLSASLFALALAMPASAADVLFSGAVKSASGEKIGGVAVAARCISETVTSLAGSFNVTTSGTAPGAGDTPRAVPSCLASSPAKTPAELITDPAGSTTSARVVKRSTLAGFSASPLVRAVGVSPSVTMDDNGRGRARQPGNGSKTMDNQDNRASRRCNVKCTAGREVRAGWSRGL